MAVLLGSIEEEKYNIVDKDGAFLTILTMGSEPRFYDSPHHAYSYTKKDAMAIVNELKRMPKYDKHHPIKIQLRKPYKFFDY
jgi:hypothetical protein